jgi:hypothetical protein
VVGPPFQVGVIAQGLEAGMVADLVEQAGDVRLFERLGFAVAPDESRGPGWFGQAASGAHAPGLAVVGRKGHAASDGDSDSGCFAVIDQAGEFHVERDLVGRHVDDLEGAGQNVAAQIDRDDDHLAVGGIP